MKWLWGVLGLGLLVATGCATIYNPATGKQETVLTSDVEIALGNMARAQMGLRSLSVGKVKPEELERVQRIGKELALVSDRQDVPYEFGVIKKKSLNAFTLPGGTIYVHTGLAEKATDDELAAVLGHEVGHVAARHVAKHLQWDLGMTALLSIASSAGAGAETGRMVNSVYGLISNGFSRQDELEADRLAIRYCQRTGYDPQGLVSFFKKMDEEHPENAMDRALVWQRTHPLTSERIQQAQEEITRSQGKSFCPVCGRTYGPDNRFCKKDGTMLKKKTPGGAG